MSYLQAVRKARIPLSAIELLDIATLISRDFSPQFALPRLDKSKRRFAFSAKELLDISREISRDYQVRKIAVTADLALLPVDPTHLQVYWRIPSEKLPAIQSDIGQKLILRVFSQEMSVKENAKHPEIHWRDVEVSGLQGNQPLPLADAENTVWRQGRAELSDFKPTLGPLAGRNRLYSASIGVIDQSRDFISVCRSQPVAVYYGMWAQPLNYQKALLEVLQPGHLVASARHFIEHHHSESP